MSFGRFLCEKMGVRPETVRMWRIVMHELVPVALLEAMLKITVYAVLFSVLMPEQVNVRAVHFWPTYAYEMHNVTIRDIAIKPGERQLFMVENDLAVYSFPVTYDDLHPFLLNEGLLIPSSMNPEEPGLPADGKYMMPHRSVESFAIHIFLREQASELSTEMLLTGGTVSMAMDTRVVDIPVMSLTSALVRLMSLPFQLARFISVVMAVIVISIPVHILCGKIKKWNNRRIERKYGENWRKIEAK